MTAAGSPTLTRSERGAERPPPARRTLPVSDQRPPPALDSDRRNGPGRGDGDSPGQDRRSPSRPSTVGRPGPAPAHPAAVAPPLPRRFAIANQKGGVGKTTTAVNLGAALAELDYRVLVVDLDPQGNATTGLGINARNLDASIYDVILHDVPIEDVIEPTTLRNLFVVPATIDLAGAEIELVPVFSRELRLRRALEAIEADFDFILIDCPPRWDCSRSTAWPPPARWWSRSSASTTPSKASDSCCGMSAWSRATSTPSWRSAPSS